MLPLELLSPAIAKQIQFVLCDIDDTITTDGRLTAEAFGAVEMLSDAGLKVIPITGRPAGWCDHIARFWPVDAVVGENGAFYMRYDVNRRKMQQRFWAEEPSRIINRKKLDALAVDIQRAVPRSAPASDQPYRVADLAIDFCEDVDRLTDTEIEQIVTMFRAAGATTKVSSIHVNGWFGQYDKLTMTRCLFADVYRQPTEQLQAQILFIGDSPNDESMFDYFDLSVGVANVEANLHNLVAKPKYICQAKGGAGFMEMAQALVKPRTRALCLPSPR